MRILKEGRVLEDAWQRVADDQPLPEGDVLVSLARWRAERETLLARGGRLGVVVDGATPLAELLPDLPRLALVAVEFPKFSDGRCFSQAVLLRTRHGYRGELRAVGEVLRDQLLYMRRCGIDSFALAEGRDAEEALRAFGEFSLAYQPGADGQPTVSQLRAREGAR